jgi:hypothetical protein
VEGFGKKRDPGGFGDSMDEVGDSVDWAAGAIASTEGDETKPEVG